MGQKRNPDETKKYFALNENKNMAYQNMFKLCLEKNSHPSNSYVKNEESGLSVHLKMWRKKFPANYPIMQVEGNNNDESKIN